MASQTREQADTKALQARIAELEAQLARAAGVASFKPCTITHRDGSSEAGYEYRHGANAFPIRHTKAVWIRLVAHVQDGTIKPE